MDLMESMKVFGARAGLQDSALEKALHRIMLSASSVVSQQGPGSEAAQARLYSGVLQNMKDNPMLVAWALKVAASVSDPVWRRFVDNFVMSVVSKRKDVVEKRRLELGYPPPITLVLNPTMRCDLRCQGCYSHSFDKQADMDRALLERILSEARQMGVQFITVTGGEPFVYPQIEEVFARFPDIIFMVYTNGQSIDQARADRLAQLGNVWPAISVEGFEEHTDQRRGPGVYRGILRAMEHLRKSGTMFGISAMPTRQNAELLSTDGFLDHFISLGALFGWMFTYLPVGKNPDPDLMATPEQRDALRRQGLRWRQTRPFFWVDFWNDGPLCGGCMSASRYAFISSDGWVQPCTFVHFATHNIQDMSLAQILDTPLFRTIRERQPYSGNLLRPCKIIDHPQVLREIVKATGARPTCPGADAVISDPKICRHLDRYSLAYAVLADRAWKSKDYCQGRSVPVPFFGRVDLHQTYQQRMANALRQDRKAESVMPLELDQEPRHQDPGSVENNKEFIES